MKNLSIRWTVLPILILAALAAGLWIQQDLDRRIVIGHNFVYEHSAIRCMLEAVSDYGNETIALLYSGLLFLVYPRNEKTFNNRLFLCILLTLLLGSSTSELFKIIFSRERPIIDLEHAIRLSSISHSYAFPSGHSTNSMSLALPFVLLAIGRPVAVRTVQYVAAGLALSVCYSRVALQRHYLSDVLAGISLALICVLISRWIVLRLPEHAPGKSPGRLSSSRWWGMIYLGVSLILWFF